MVTGVEKAISRLLRSVLANLSTGELVPDSKDFQELLLYLTGFVPMILSEIHPEWKFEGIDDIYLIEARKTGEEEAEILALCCYVKDSTLTPIYLQLQNGADSDEITWFVCKQGERRSPYSNFNAMVNYCKSLPSQEREISWDYQVTYGDRRE
ncbi:MAG: hypothetical protein ACO1RA_17945 [Planctomycetaceae bacterium]